MANLNLKFGLSSEIISDFYHVFEQFPQIEKVLIFGSRAKGTAKPGSDIDLAVIAAGLSDKEFTEVWNRIDELPMVFKVDCLHWDHLDNLQLKEKILKEGKLFYP